MKPDVSVVVPAYNESESIPLFVDAASKYVNTIDFFIQFVFVDDGSADSTLQMLRDIEIPGADCKVVKLSRNYGSHPAIRAGSANSDADYVVVYSMDMPYPIEDITRIREELLAGNELVYLERVGYRGSWGSRKFAKMVQKYIEPSYPAEGLVGIAYGSKIKEQLRQHPEKNSSIFFQVFQMGYTRKALKVEYVEREAGSSKWSLRKKIKLFIDSFVGFSYMPIHVIAAVGGVLAAAGIIWALVIVILKLFNIVQFDAGWPSLMAVLLVGIGIINISLGIISEYLVRNLEATRERPAFLVDEVYEKKSSVRRDE